MHVTRHRGASLRAFGKLVVRNFEMKKLIKYCDIKKLERRFLYLLREYPQTQDLQIQNYAKRNGAAYPPPRLVLSEKSRVMISEDLMMNSC